ncbi:T9SS type A sorting domain-containing protein [Pedobacter sp. SD-b]|uniref:T9SS type A sorting domain-containing protein n=1 Tax=Pedobacter segetis TaxID=2793069 RepID=A0ABS1BFL8_9SPHI|nr:T9SS type A sorting domain-containing protein [Pedobacter segetis]MBK0381664.1 T9SS type A sorting domain-containing protein [Pedobacter segetis]
MKNKYLKITLATVFIFANFAMVFPALSKGINPVVDTIINNSVKIKDNRPNRPVFKTNIPSDFESFMFQMTSLKIGSKNTEAQSKQKQESKNVSSVGLELTKPIDNVKIYPNPVSNQLNLSYSLNKPSVVTVKIMDVLGNEVAVLMSQKVEAGNQSNKFFIESKLNSGFYFLRIVAGSDSIIKRISVL